MKTKQILYKSYSKLYCNNMMKNKMICINNMKNILILYFRNYKIYLLNN